MDGLKQKKTTLKAKVNKMQWSKQRWQLLTDKNGVGMCHVCSYLFRHFIWTSMSLTVSDRKIAFRWSL